MTHNNPPLPTDDAELREQIALWLTKWTGDITFKEHGSIDELMVHIKARDAAIRIDELERIKPSTGDIVLIKQKDPTKYAHDIVVNTIKNRIAALRRESDLGRRNDKEENHG